MVDQRHQFQVLVGDDTTHIGEADQLPDDVGGPIHFPGKVNAFFIWVYPKPPVALSCVIYIAYF